jgi:uncharacterized membrane protein SirB2
MLEYYLQVKWVHVAAVLCSGSLFALRGALVQFGASRWAMAAPLRFASYAVDTVLLTAALMLLTMLPHAVFANGWLLVKLGLLVLYVLLDTFALKRGRTAGVRRACLVAALATFCCMLAVARTHDPLGPLRLLQSAAYVGSVEGPVRCGGCTGVASDGLLPAA